MAGDCQRAAGRVRKHKRNVLSLWDSVDDEGWMAGVAFDVYRAATTRPPPGQHPKGICRTNMVVWMIVSDTWGGWTRPRANSLRPLLSLSSPMEERERERERERAWYTHFFPHTLHLDTSSKTAKFQGQSQFFQFSHTYSSYGQLL